MYRLSPGSPSQLPCRPLIADKRPRICSAADGRLQEGLTREGGQAVAELRHALLLGNDHGGADVELCRTDDMVQLLQQARSGIRVRRTMLRNESPKFTISVSRIPFTPSSPGMIRRAPSEMRSGLVMPLTRISSLMSTSKSVGDRGEVLVGLHDVDRSRSASEWDPVQRPMKAEAGSPGARSGKQGFAYTLTIFTLLPMS